MTQQKLEMAPPCPCTLLEVTHHLGKRTTPAWLVSNSRLEIETELPSKARTAVHVALCGMYFPLAASTLTAWPLNVRHLTGSWHFLTHPLPPAYEMGPSLIFQRREMRPREVKSFVPSHSGSKWQSRDSNLGTA